MIILMNEMFYHVKRISSTNCRCSNLLRKFVIEFESEMNIRRFNFSYVESVRSYLITYFSIGWFHKFELACQIICVNFSNQSCKKTISFYSPFSLLFAQPFISITLDFRNELQITLIRIRQRWWRIGFSDLFNIFCSLIQPVFGMLEFNQIEDSSVESWVWKKLFLVEIADAEIMPRNASSYMEMCEIVDDTLHN